MLSESVKQCNLTLFIVCVSLVCTEYSLLSVLPDKLHEQILPCDSDFGLGAHRDGFERFYLFFRKSGCKYCKFTPVEV